MKQSAMIDRIKNIIKSWWIQIFYFIFVFVWYIFAYFIFTSPVDQWTLLLLYVLFVPGFIWLMIGKIILDNKEKIINKLNEKKPGSRPFEYLFFIFLFIATYYVTIVSSYINDLFEPSRFLFHFSSISIFYVGSLVCGWLHYIERITSKNNLNSNSIKQIKTNKRETETKNKTKGKIKILFIVFIVLGLSISLFSLHYFTNKNDVEDGLTIVIDEIDCTVRIKYQSLDGFIAYNPIEFSAESTFDEDIDIKDFAIVFRGAEKYYSTKNPDDPISVDYNQSVLHLSYLQKDENNLMKLYGSKSITYNKGGDFDISVQWTVHNSTKLGQFNVSDALQIENFGVLKTIESNRLISGLSVLIVGLALFFPGLNGIIRFAIGNKNN